MNDRGADAFIHIFRTFRRLVTVELEMLSPDLALDPDRLDHTE
jgi:lipoate synthase